MDPERGTYAEIVERRIKTECVDFIFPEVTRIIPMGNQETVDAINTAIEELVSVLIPDNISDVNGCSVTVTGRSEVTVNQNAVLSIRIEVFSFPFMAANGSTTLKALTFNLNTAEQVMFYQLFKRNTDYRIVIDQIIREQVEKRNIPAIGDIPRVTDNQEYYLTEDSLVVFFQELVFTPHVVGPPEFPIPYQLLANMIRKDGPIGLILNK